MDSGTSVSDTPAVPDLTEGDILGAIQELTGETSPSTFRTLTDSTFVYGQRRVVVEPKSPAYGYTMIVLAFDLEHVIVWYQAGPFAGRSVLYSVDTLVYASDPV